MRVLVTGGSGFTGQHLLRYLADLGGSLSLFGLSRRRVHGPLAQYLQCDLLDRASVCRAIHQIQPEYVIHLAGAIGDCQSELFFRENVMGTLSLLEALREERPQARILVVGSSAEYGLIEDGSGIATEETPLRPINAYGSSKLAQVALALQYGRGYGLSVTVARPFNLVGPNLPSTVVCGTIAKQIVERERGVSDGAIRIGDLKAARDFVDVRDVARAYWLVVTQGRCGQVYNVASGVAVTIEEVVTILLALGRVECTVEMDSSRLRSIDIPAQAGSSALIEKELGWRPTYMLRQSLKDLLDSYRSGGP